MLARPRRWLALKKLKLASKWADQYGFTVVRIIQRGNSMYIVNNHGEYHRIGKK